ncbi:MAG TPA: hypothetical protein VGI93_20930 [Steroidobacteraceae bacterium]|jgi:hypothetical protein
MMLDRARTKHLYRNLFLGSVEASGISEGDYDTVIMSLVDEHLPTLDLIYREAGRLSSAQARFVVAGMHPSFFMMGMPTHFEDPVGNPEAIETYVHLVSDHVRSAHAAGWKLAEMYEGLIDDDWIRIKPKWAAFRNHPVNFGYVWNRRSTQDLDQ